MILFCTIIQLQPIIQYLSIKSNNQTPILKYIFLNESIKA